MDFRLAWFSVRGHVASEAACLPGEVTAAIVGQPLDGDRQAIDHAEAMLDGCEYQITKVLAADAACRGTRTPLTVVAADLIGTAAVALIASDASVMPRAAKEDLQSTP